MIAVVGLRIPPSVQEIDSAVYITAHEAKRPFSARYQTLLTLSLKGNIVFAHNIRAHEVMRISVLLHPRCKSRRSRGSLQTNASLPPQD
jgi:hypothetical protein